MGILSALLNTDSSGAHEVETTGAAAETEDRAWGWESISGFEPTPITSGVTVTKDNATNFVPVYACVRLISESIASLPLDVYAPRSGRTEVIVGPSWLTQPNEEMGYYEFVERVLNSLLIWGNAYIGIVRDDLGNILELIPQAPKAVNVTRNGRGELDYSINGTKVAARDLLHIKAMPSADGILGLSPVDVGRASISAGMATEQYAGSFFGNGAQPSLVVSIPAGTDQPGIVRIAKAWAKRYQGSRNSHKTAFLTDGATVTPISANAQDSQLLETRKFHVNEIARLYRVPPHLIGDLDRATFTNIEAQGREFVEYTLRPWMTRIEEALSSLLPNKNFVKFNEKALLRGDTAAQNESLRTAWANGWMSTNEVREKLELPPIDGGDTFWVPLNMSPLDVAAHPNEGPDTNTAAIGTPSLDDNGGSSNE